MSAIRQTPGGPDLVYTPAPDLEIIPLDEAAWLCQTATQQHRLAGPAVRFVVEQLIPAARAGITWTQLCAHLADADPGELRQVLDTLVANGILRAAIPQPPQDSVFAPLLAMLDVLHQEAPIATERLAQAQIAIFGLEGVGAQLAVLLARYGIRRFVLVDPYPCQPGNLALWPVGERTGVGQPRQDLVAAAVRAASLAPQEVEIRLGGPLLSEPSVAALVAGCTCVVSCFDEGLAASHAWINRAALAAGVPAVYAETRGHQGYAGPLVVADQTACYTCYRMRAVAAAVDSAAALAYEGYRDRQTLPHLHDRAVLPMLLPVIAGVLATTVLQVLLAFEQPPLAGRVWEWQALTLGNTLHPVLRQPDCPDCGRSIPPAQPDRVEWGRDGIREAGSGSPAATALISARTGLIRAVRPYEKDAAEPALPYICEVKLANYHYRPGIPEEDLTSWGKGWSEAEAQARGIGEAIERYGADHVPPGAVIYARRAELDGPSVNPADLVLYAPDQYTHLPYHPYNGNCRLGWVRGCSLQSGEAMYLPAPAVFLGYTPQTSEEQLFPSTSNGLAAGTSLAQAICAATYEVVERDSFMITWFARLPTQRVDPQTHPDPMVVALCRAYARRSVEIGLWRLPTDHPVAVFLALGLDTAGGPAAIAGLGADLDPAAAARKAILEVGQIRPSYRRSLRRPAVRARLAELVADPQRVTTMHDHGLLYCSPAMRPALAFLLDRPVETADWPPVGGPDPQDQLETVLTAFQARGQDVLYYNLTPPDVAPWGLAVARVILPGFQPVAFGAQEMRLGGPRLYELPQQLGQAATPLTRADLNPYPHPFD